MNRRWPGLGETSTTKLISACSKDYGIVHNTEADVYFDQTGHTAAVACCDGMDTTDIRFFGQGADETWFKLETDFERNYEELYMNMTDFTRCKAYWDENGDFVWTLESEWYPEGYGYIGRLEFEDQQELSDKFWEEEYTKTDEELEKMCRLDLSMKLVLQRVGDKMVEKSRYLSIDYEKFVRMRIEDIEKYKTSKTK